MKGKWHRCLFYSDDVIVPPCRRLLSLLGFLHNWPTSRWSATKKKKKKENRLSLKGNAIVVFSRATILSFHPIEGSYHSWDFFTNGQRVMVCNKKRNRFSFNSKRILSSFLGRKFYCSLALGISSQLANE